MPPILPDIERIQSATGNLPFRTRYGRLDVMKESGGETFETAFDKAVIATLQGHDVAFASLETIARMKRAAGREKDKKVLPAIEAAINARGDADRH